MWLTPAGVDTSPRMERRSASQREVSKRFPLADIDTALVKEKSGTLLICQKAVESALLTAKKLRFGLRTMAST